MYSCRQQEMKKDQVHRILDNVRSLEIDRWLQIARLHIMHNESWHGSACGIDEDQRR